jgi:hypothetical protein
MRSAQQATAHALAQIISALSAGLAYPPLHKNPPRCTFIRKLCMRLTARLIFVVLLGVSLSVQSVSAFTSFGPSPAIDFLASVERILSAPTFFLDALADRVSAAFDHLSPTSGLTYVQSQRLTAPPYSPSAQRLAASAAASQVPSVAPATNPPPSVLAAATTTVIKQYITQPVVDRSTFATAATYVTENELAGKLNDLRNSLQQEISWTTAPVVSGPSAPVSLQTFAPSQRIDQLNGTKLNNVTVSGVSGLTTADIPSLSGSYLPLGGGTLTGALVNSGTASSSFAGALGIGTTSPSDTLAINGPVFLANVSPAATTNRLYSNAGSLYWAGSVIGGASTGNWTSDGTNVWRVGGNVGIGTTSPSYALDILNSGFQLQRLLSPNNDALITLGSNIASSQYWTFGATSNVSGQGSNLFTIDTSNMNGGGVTQRLVINSSGNVGIGTTTPQSALAVSSGESIGANYNLAAPSNGLIVQGNVGIGTTNPGAALQVNGQTYLLNTSTAAPATANEALTDLLRTRLDYEGVASNALNSDGTTLQVRLNYGVTNPATVGSAGAISSHSHIFSSASSTSETTPLLLDLTADASARL